MHGKRGAVDVEFTVKVKSKEAELSEVEIKHDEVIPKNIKDRKSETSNDLWKYTNVEVKSIDEAGTEENVWQHQLEMQWVMTPQPKQTEH